MTILAMKKIHLLYIWDSQQWLSHIRSFYQKKRKKEKKDNTFVLHIDFFS